MNNNNNNNIAWVADVCEGVGVGISLAYARNAGINNNNINKYACKKEERARMVVCGA